MTKPKTTGARQTITLTHTDGNHTTAACDNTTGKIIFSDREFARKTFQKVQALQAAGFLKPDVAVEEIPLSPKDAVKAGLRDVIAEGPIPMTETLQKLKIDAFELTALDAEIANCLGLEKLPFRLEPSMTGNAIAAALVKSAPAKKA